VSQELTAEFGRGFTYTEVTRMIRFAEDFQDQQIVGSLAQQLSWGHFRVLLPVKEPLARDFYAELCRIEHWDVRTLRKKIGGMLFQRTTLAKKPQQVIAAEIGQLRAGQLSPDVVFRDPYFLDLLGLTGAYSEADLESAILRQIEGVLLELDQRLALSRDQEEIRRLATEGQVVEKAAHLLLAPTVRSKQAQGIALGDSFAWQAGFGAFAVSESNVPAVRDYIAGQQEHHRKKSFQDEYRAFLVRHGVDFDERYVWD
jgi:predicted nuclease of restriction endonuclease-like (RecB) superfamily